MNKVKIINEKTGVIKEVPNSLASDYLGTGEYKIYTAPVETKPKKSVRE